jgi:hypothetical protein
MHEPDFQESTSTEQISGTGKFTDGTPNQGFTISGSPDWGK